MNCCRLFAACKRDIQSIAEKIRRRVIRGVRPGEDALKIRTVKFLDVGIILDVIRIIYREKTDSDRTIIQKQVCEKQCEENRGVNRQRASGSRRFSRLFRNWRFSFSGDLQTHGQTGAGLETAS